MSIVIKFVTRAFPCNCINVPAVFDDYDCRTVCADRFRTGFLECEVSRIQFAGPCSVCTGCRGCHCDFAVCWSSLGHSCQIGISIVIRVLDHINDLIFALRRCPLCIKSCIVFQFVRRSGCFSAVLISIPARKSITGTGRCCRQRDLGAVRRCYRIDVLALADVIGERKVSACVIYFQFLAGITGNRYILVPVIVFRKSIIVDVRCNLGIFDTDFVNYLNLFVRAAAGQGLQVMSDFIICIGGNILIFYFIYIFAAILGELILGNRNGWILRIICRLIGNLGRNGITGCCYRIGEIVLYKVKHLGRNIYPFSVIIIVEIVNSELISLNILKDSYCIEGFGNNRSYCHRGML